MISAAAGKTQIIFYIKCEKIVKNIKYNLEVIACFVGPTIRLQSVTKDKEKEDVMFFSSTCGV